MKKTICLVWSIVLAFAVLSAGKVQAGSTNVLSVCDEPSLRAAVAIGGWVSVTCNGIVTLANTITITNNVILDASGVSFGISGGNAVQIFYVTNGAGLGATNLTLANGSCIIVTNSAGTNADGGAIYNDGGVVTLVSCILTNNSAQALINFGTARGGAIFNNGGTMALFQSTIVNSLALGGGPNSPVPSRTNYYDPITIVVDTGLGGAVYNASGAITITGCNISNNVCKSVIERGYLNTSHGTGIAMGGAVYQESGSLMVMNSCFESNRVVGDAGPPDLTGTPSPAYGGAMAITGGSLSLDHSVFAMNEAVGGAAGDGTILPAGNGGLAYGGAIYCTALGTSADSSYFGNQAIAGAGDYKAAGGCGGGIYNAGGFELDRCSIYSNAVQGGAGVIFNDGSYSAGGDALGAGIFNAAQIAFTNCTIAFNSATAGSGSEYISSLVVKAGDNGTALGAGLYNDTSATSIMMNVTVASNSCVATGPSYVGTNGLASGFQVAGTNGTLSLHNTIIAYSGTNLNAYGAITDLGHNLSSDGSANFSGAGSLNNTDPLLGPLANYGGPTWCMALHYNSPAIDAGDSAGAPATDQRGAARPNGAGVDIGAYEFYSDQITIPTLSIVHATNKVTMSFQAYPAGVYHLLTSPDLKSWTDAETFGPYTGLTNISWTVYGQIGFCRLMLP